jgi:tetratricopeptide (TPR) repeat protein
LVCEFIQQQFGFDKLAAMLQQFKNDSDTVTAIQKVFGIAPKDFDTQFKAFIDARYGKLLAQLDDWRKARASSVSAASKGRWQEAADAANTALALLPTDVEDGSPYLPLAQAYDKAGKQADALSTLETYWKKGGHDPDALKSLAQRLYAQNRKSDALAVMQDVNYVAPFDYALHGDLGDWLLEADRAEQALREYQVAMALNPPDRAVGYYRLARAQQALQRNDEAKRNLLAALEIAPNYRPAQKMLLEMSRGQ